MIFANNLQKMLLNGPRTKPAVPGESALDLVPIVVEVRMPGGVEMIQVSDARIEKDRYVLSIDAAGLVLSLAERVAGQSEALGAVAEKAIVERMEQTVGKKLKLVSPPPPGTGDSM